MLIVTILNCNYGKCNHYVKWTYGKCYFRQTFMASAIMAELFITKVLWQMQLNLIKAYLLILFEYER